MRKVLIGLGFGAVVGAVVLSSSRVRAPATPSTVLTGKASWYGPGFHGRQTANQEIYNENAMTCAHKTLKFGTKLEVTDNLTGRSVVVRVNDRGPFVAGRILDLSKAAAESLDMIERGVINVTARVV